MSEKPQVKKSWATPEDAEPKEEAPEPTFQEQVIEALNKIVEAINNLSQKVEEMNKTFSPLVAVFTEASKRVKQEIQAQAKAQAQANVVKPVPSKLSKVREALKEYTDILEFDVESSATQILIKPKKYLGAEAFANIARIVRELGGTYISAGKASHFEVPKD